MLKHEMVCIPDRQSQKENKLRFDFNLYLIDSFKSYINQDLKGFYRSSYFDEASNLTRHLAVTQFESHFARLAFPCLDEPDFKAEFTVSITARNGYFLPIFFLSMYPVSCILFLNLSPSVTFS
jgi:aminopeptidase N